MHYLLIQFIPTFIFLLSLVVPLAMMWWIRHQRKEKRNPLTVDMLRAPGESIAERIRQLDDDIDALFPMFGIAPLATYSTYISTRYVSNMPASPWFFVLLATGILFLISIRLAKLMKKRHANRLGLDCERAVGQELNQLMFEGCRVFHDFPAENFNIDHIVVGENGVLAIETKGRAKPDRGRGAADAQVVYDGESLKFPGWVEREPISQAKRQAEWLTKWLSSAVGERVVVKPGLAFPGWYVDRKERDFLIFSGRNLQFLAKTPTETSLSPSLVQRVAHQIEQRCRDVKPQAYQKIR